MWKRLKKKLNKRIKEWLGIKNPAKTLVGHDFDEDGNMTTMILHINLTDEQKREMQKNREITAMADDMVVERVTEEEAAAFIKGRNERAENEAGTRVRLHNDTDLSLDHIPNIKTYGGVTINGGSDSTESGSSYDGE